jgi:hypothetical protein
MQKVITVIFSAVQVANTKENDPGASYQNKELNDYLAQGYFVKQTIPMQMADSRYITITFILEKSSE